MSSERNSKIKNETVRNRSSEDSLTVSKFFGVDNYQKLCRACLSSDCMELVPLLLPDEKNSLSVMFTTLTAIDVHENDGFPGSLCISCRAEVEHCYEFKVRCEKSDRLLKSLSIEQNDDNSLPTRTLKLHDVVKNEIKEEADEVTDIQYLEDICSSDTQSTYEVQDKIKNEDELEITFTDSSVLLEELVTSKKKTFHCTYCDKSFQKVKALRDHKQRSHYDVEHSNPCGLCRESFDSEHDLKLHSALHAKGPWDCAVCKKKFQTRTVFRRHLHRHMERKRYTCARCGKAFAERYALQRHARVHTGQAAEKRHACQLCDKRYSEASLLAAHMARHSGARPCVCASCGKTFPSERLLSSHRLTHSEDKAFPCQYCDKRFRHESTRNTHHRTHTGEKPYVCSVCGKTFIQNSNLTLHMRTHTGERPYSCSVCERRFSSGSTLKSHARIHTGEKPYSCEICGKRFARLDMKTHLRSHTGERPFQCSACPKGFTSAPRLRDHCRIHTGEKPFECAMCPLKYTTKSHLAKHMKTHNTKRKKTTDVQHFIIEEEPYAAEKLVFTEHTEDVVMEIDRDNDTTKEITIEEEMPLEVTEELVLQEDGEIKTEVLLVDDGHNNSVCLTSDVNYVNNLNYGSDVNLVTVNEGEVSISTSSQMVETASVKLYQLDQSLVQIHSSGGQVTISKITSKMTANF